MKYLPKFSSSTLICEIGCGNGFLLSSLSENISFGSDINWQACCCTRDISNS